MDANIAYPLSSRFSWCKKRNPKVLIGFLIGLLLPTAVVWYLVGHPDYVTVLKGAVILSVVAFILALAALCAAMAALSGRQP